MPVQETRRIRLAATSVGHLVRSVHVIELVKQEAYTAGSLKNSYHDCGATDDNEHVEECIAAEHRQMLAGDPDAAAYHDADGCEECLLARPPITSDCRCGNCCRSLLIEVTELDARREPLIREKGSPTYLPPELTRSGQRELIGYLLNGKDAACVFLDQRLNLCTIHATRPLICRLFDCDTSECRPAQ